MLRFSLDGLSLEKLSFFRPLLQYGDVVWDPHNIYLINILERVQIEAMGIILGGTKLTPLRELYKETGFLKLKDRRENREQDKIPPDISLPTKVPWRKAL